MKVLAIIRKSLIEQYRQFWLLILTISMAPFFIGIYYLMWDSSKLHLNIVVVNQDLGTESNHYGNEFMEWASQAGQDTLPIYFRSAQDQAAAIQRLKSKKSDAILVLPPNFSSFIEGLRNGDAVQVPFEMSGDLTDTNYMLASIWGYESVLSFIEEVSGMGSFIAFTETPVGISGNIDEFDLYVPGLLILSTVMLMFTASIAFVRESEQNTIVRLKLSKLRNWELITGIGFVQILVGLLSILLSLGLAMGLGFRFNGSWGSFLLITSLTSLSIVAFSLIVAAVTKTVNQVLIAGNFPLFLFMFFTGAMMPMHGPTIFQFAGYDFTLPGLMSPYHGVQALKKISIYQADLIEVWPEISCLVGLSIVYFLIGSWLYKKQHLQIL